MYTNRIGIFVWHDFEHTDKACCVAFMEVIYRVGVQHILYVFSLSASIDHAYLVHNTHRFIMMLLCYNLCTPCEC